MPMPKEEKIKRLTEANRTALDALHSLEKVHEILMALELKRWANMNKASDAAHTAIRGLRNMIAMEVGHEIMGSLEP